MKNWLDFGTLRADCVLWLWGKDSHISQMGEPCWTITMYWRFNGYLTERTVMHVLRSWLGLTEVVCPFSWVTVVSWMERHVSGQASPFHPDVDKLSICPSAWKLPGPAGRWWEPGGGPHTGATALQTPPYPCLKKTKPMMWSVILILNRTLIQWSRLTVILSFCRKCNMKLWWKFTQITKKRLVKMELKIVANYLHG